MNVSPRARSPVASDQRLADCLKRVSEAEKTLALTREVLTQICSESSGGRRSSVQSPRLQPIEGASSASPAVRPISGAASGRGDVRLSPEARQKCREVFNSADEDGSGFINRREMKNLLQRAGGVEVSDSDLQRVMAETDSNFDGMASFEEFEYAFFMTQEQRAAQRRNQMYELGRDSRSMHESAQEIVKSKGVRQRSVLRYLRKELAEHAACLALPQALAIFVLFSLAVLFHYNMETLHGTDTAITWDIRENANFAFVGITPFENGRMGHKNLDDVNSIADFWSWMTLGLTPVFWPTGWDVDEVRGNVAAKCWSDEEAFSTYGWNSTLVKNASKTSGIGALECSKIQEAVRFPADLSEFLGNGSVDGRYLLYNTIVGGVRLRQERTRTEDCPDETMRRLYKGRCIERGDFYWLKPELREGLRMDEGTIDEPGGATVHLLSGWKQEKVREELNQLQNSAWFSALTNKIEVLFTTYNPKEDLVTATYVNLFMSPSGHMHKFVEPVSFYIRPYNSWAPYLFDILWVLLIWKLLVEETIEVIRHWRQLGFVKGTTTYMSLANAVDWISLIYAFALLIYWCTHLTSVSKVRDLLERGDASIPGTWNSFHDRREFYDLVDDCVYETHTFRTMLAVYPFVIVSRFFKAFSSQPRLSLVTQTVTKASVDIFHFFVVFGTVFLVFALSAHILWGQELNDYANIGRSVHTTFRMLLGDFDWAALHSVGRPQAYLWFWAFTWGLSIIMLNMLVAIVLDVYTEVKGGIGSDAETLWSQSQEIFHRWQEVRKGHALHLATILNTLDPTSLEEDDDEQEDERILFTDSFCAEVAGLTQEQAFNILLASQQLEIAEARAGSSLTDSSLRIEAIDVNVKKVQKLLGDLIAVNSLSSIQSVTV